MTAINRTTTTVLLAHAASSEELRADIMPILRKLPDGARVDDVVIEFFYDVNYAQDAVRVTHRTQGGTA